MLTDRARDLAIGGILRSPTVMVGLLTASGEVVSDNYMRQLVWLSLPRPGNTGRVVANGSEVRFPPMLSQTVVTGWLLADEQGELAREALAPRQYEINDAPVFRAGALSLEIV